MVFSDETEENLIEVSIDFDVDWNLGFQYFIPNYPLKFTHEFKSDLAVFPIHIPRVNKQYLFTKSMDYVIKETDMPAHISIIKHPGYNLLAVSFNPSVIQKEKMRKIIETIVKAVESAKVTETEKPKPEVLEKDPLDEIDEEKVVEFEFDEEVKNYKNFFDSQPEHTEETASGFTNEIIETEEDRNDD